METITLSVVDREREEVVVTATVTPPETTFELGVPAEVPLEFIAVARTADPAPDSLGGTMPAYVGRGERTIALDREIRPVVLRARPGGALDLRFLPESETGGTLFFSLRAPQAELPDRLRIELSDPSPGVVRILESGPWSGRVEAPDDYAVPGAGGLVVEPEAITHGRLVVQEAPEEPRSDDPTALSFEWLDESGEVRQPPFGVDEPRQLTLRVRGVDAEGRPRSASDLRLSLLVSAVPAEAIEISTASARSLPATLPGFVIRQPARIFVRAQVVLETRQVLVGRVAFNAFGPGESPGPPEQLTLEVEDPSELIAGTGLRLALVDGDGKFAAPGDQVSFDLEDSDAFVFLPAGRVGPFVGSAQVVPLFRVSEREGVPVEIRATVTSGTPAGSWTQSLTLPPLLANR